MKRAVTEFALLGCLTVSMAGLMFAAGTTSGCARQGLARSAADGALQGCVEWAQTNGDAELLVLCQAGRPLTEILDLFAARKLAGTSRDAGADR